MSLSIAALLLAAWGLVQGVARRRALLLIAALLLAVAGASLGAAAGASDAVPPISLPSGDLDRVIHQVAAGLTLLALGVAVAASPHVVTIAWAALVVWLSIPLWQVGGLIRPAGYAAMTAAVAVFGWIFLARARPGRLLVVLDRKFLDPQDRVSWRPGVDWVPTAWPLVAVSGATVALLVPHLATNLGGALVAVIASFAASRQGGRAAWGLLPAIPLLLVILLWSLHLSGPLGGWIPNLIDGPFSPRASQLLAAMTAMALLPMAGLWPLHGVSLPVMLAPAVVAVGAIFAASLVPDGIQWWQPLLAPLAVAAMLHAVARRQAPQLLVAAGAFGLWTGTPAGAIGGAVLLLTAWVMVVAPSTWMARMPVSPVGMRLLGLPAVAASAAILVGGLATEVVYTLAAVFTAAAGILILSDEGATLVDPRA